MEKDIIKKYKRFNFQKLSMILLIVDLILTTWNKLSQTSQSMRTKKLMKTMYYYQAVWFNLSLRS